MSVFFQGDLSSAIAASVQSKKDFAAYIYTTENDDVEAAAICVSWEDDLTSNEIIRNYFALSSVFLKIRQNSTEYGHLSALVPDIKAPSIIVLRQGQLQHRFEDLDALVQHCQLFDQAIQWQRRTVEQAAVQSATSTPIQQPAATSSQTAAAEVPPTPIPSAAPSIAPSGQTASSQSTTRFSAPQPGRQHLEPTPTLQAVTSEEDPPPPQSSRGQPSVQTPLSSSTETLRSSATRSWATEQRERNLEARRERDRVLAQIESDKRARKAKAAERKNLASLNDAVESTATAKNRASTNSSSCRIQIRLISGRTVRQTFDPQATPASDLRPLIDAELANDTEGAKVPAYRLKRMGIPPEPTREIGLSEEQQSLSELGLLPSATLVVTPIHGATDAYANTGNGWGLLSLPASVVGGAASMAMGAVGAVGGALTSTLGFGGGSRPEDQSQQEDRPVASGTAARVRTLHEVRAENDREDQNFYNGNQLSFQSNDADDK